MRSLATKLAAGLSIALLGALLLLGRANLRVLRENLEAATLQSAERIADVIFRSTRHAMLVDNRAEQQSILGSIAAQDAVRSVRVYSKSGSILYSGDPAEAGHQVDKRAEACYGCHASSQPLQKLVGRERFRVYPAGGERRLGLIRPIENEPSCSQAACHAHPESQRVLGVLDVVLSLEKVDRSLAAYERRMRAQVSYSAAGLLGAVALLVWFFLGRPLVALERGVRELAAGNLSFRFHSARRDEIGDLAGAFDRMASEVETSKQSLEARIEARTRELETARESLEHQERLASLGELAASVAHELNSPLAGIVTYARLLERKLEPSPPASGWIETISHEAKRCGRIVEQLLVFARRRETHLAPAAPGAILGRALALVRHRLDTASIRVDAPHFHAPLLECDAMQIEQVLVAVLNNAADALEAAPSGYRTIWIHAQQENGRFRLSITNNGPPIPKELLPHLFEPFVSTKPAASGVGLGLAVAYGIMRRHGGEILAETGELTTFHLILPLGHAAAPAAAESHDERTLSHLHRG